MKSLRLPFKSLLIIGPTGSGKTPLGNHLEKSGIKDKRCFHFDFGHELRSIADLDSPPDGFNSAEHLFIRDVLEKGLLLENEDYCIAEKIIYRFINQKKFNGNEILILNGLPRHVDQAKDMNSIASVEDLVILECTTDDVIRRIRDNTGNDRTERVDDTIEMIQKKLKIFKERTKPLIDHYSNTGSTVHRIRVTPSLTTERLYDEFISRVTISPHEGLL